MAFVYLTISAIIVHVMPYLSSVGIARSTSSVVAMAIPLTSVVGRLAGGWLSDRFNKRRVATGFFAMMGLGFLFFSYVSDEKMYLLVPFIILFGIGWGGCPPVRAALLTEYFGRTHFGTIHGVIMGMVALGSVVGPLFAGWVFDSWGSYHAAWLVFAFLTFAALIVISTAPSVGTNAQLADNG